MKQLFFPLFLIALLHGCALPQAEPPVDLLGDPAPLSMTTRTIVIGPNTRWVNVTGGEVIRFVADGKSFAWNFDVAPTVRTFELNRIAPPRLLDHPVQAYVAPDPRYIGDGKGHHGWRR